MQKPSSVDICQRETCQSVNNDCGGNNAGELM